jgi:hypothetical protein
LQPRRILAGHDHRGRDDSEAELRVVGGIPDEEDEPQAILRDEPQGRADQRPADALALAVRGDRERAEQQRWRPVEQQAPVADRADQPAAARRGP